MQGIFYDLLPNNIAIAGDNGVSSHFKRLVGKNRGMNASHDHGGAAGFGFFQEFVAREAIACADPDAHDVSRMDDTWVEFSNSFIHENGITHEFDRRCLSQDKEPPWRDHAITQGGHRRID
jgi:hypothetical protein